MGRRTLTHLPTLGINGHLLFLVANNGKVLMDQVSDWGRKGDLTRAKRFPNHGNHFRKFSSILQHIKLRNHEGRSWLENIYANSQRPGGYVRRRLREGQPSKQCLLRAGEVAPARSGGAGSPQMAGTCPDGPRPGPKTTVEGGRGRVEKIKNILVWSKCKYPAAQTGFT